MMDKDELRRRMRGMRRALTAREQEEAAQSVLTQIERFAPFQQARTVMAYMAVRGELSLAPVTQAILKSGKTLALPRCEAPGMMTARRIAAFSELERGAYGLPEPAESCEILAGDQIDLILVPGTAFDAQGRRLGQGGGYYDRFLIKTRALRVGVCHDAALLDCVPAQAHDLNMDYILMPGGIISCGRRTSDYMDIQEEQP